MDVDFAESQTTKMSRMLLTHSLRLKQCIRESDYEDIIPFNLIDKLCVILSDILKNAQELGEKILTQTVPLEHLHFFFTVLHMNLDSVEISFRATSYYVFKLNLGTQSTVDSSLVKMKFIDETLSLLFPSDFADPKEGEESHLKKKRSEIRILMKKIKSEILEIEEQLDILLAYEEITLDFVHKLQGYSNPVASCLANSPSTVCAICHYQQMAEGEDFAAVRCCSQLFCKPCLQKHLRKGDSCPACQRRFGVTISSSYMMRPAFRAGPPEKYDFIFHSKGFIARLW